MRAVDPRLLRYARATRVFLLASVALGLVGAVLVIAQAVLIATLVTGAFQDGAALAELGPELGLLALTAVGRAGVSWLTELAAHRCSAAVKSELRMRVVARTAALGPGWLAGQRTGELATLVTRGMDALDDYFARYLPQLGLAVVVPLAVLGRVVTDDWVSALVIAVTLPLIPLFMVLIGWATEAATGRQFALLTRLSGHFLDVVAGLPTLKVFGRAKAQGERIREITGEYRRVTLRTLRVAFLSSFALELLATLSVALVAVGIGLRLVHGELDLYTGLVVLILAPEAYLPLRQVGVHYHAAAEGVAAASRVFALLPEAEASPVAPAPAARFALRAKSSNAGRAGVEGEPSVAGGVTASLPGQDLPGDGFPPTGGPTPARPAFEDFTRRVKRAAGADAAGGTDAAAVIQLDGVEVRYPGRDAVILPSLTVAAGETVALAGPSGGGKSTVLATVLGFTEPAAGELRLAADDFTAWHRDVAWVPQRPHLYAGTVADNVRLAAPDADPAAVRQALCDAGAEDLDPDRPLGEDGAGLSAGQHQRVALARAFLADRPVLLLDEPTASLDGDTEASVIEAMRRLAVGRTVLLVAHRPALLALADRVVWCGPETAAAVPEEQPPAPQAHAPEVPAQAGESETAPPTNDAADAPDAPYETPRATPARIRARLALAAALGTLALLSAVGLMGTSGWLISRASEQPPVLYLMVAVTATRTFGISRAALRYVERLVSHDAVLRLLAGLRADVYRQLECIAPAGLGRTHRGDLLTRLVADVDAQQDRYLRWLLPAGQALAVCAIAVAFTAALDPLAGAALAAGLLTAGLLAPALSTAVAHRADTRLAPLRGRLGTQTVDLLAGNAELTVAGALPRRIAALRATDGELRAAAARSAAGLGAGGALGSLACGLTVVATTAAGIAAVHAGRLDGVWLATLALLPMAAFEGVAGMPQALAHRARARRSAARIAEIVQAPTPAAQGAGQPPADPFPLVLRGLGARYPGARHPVLHDLDLTLERGRRVAVVGPSGSGKTTLANVLLRFLDAERPEQYSLAPYDADAVRRLVGLCAQDAHLFDSTLRENLRLARPDAPDAELWRVLAEARLASWAATLPEGLDTRVGEGAATLSGGQRQRLALARALLADFGVLVLDEPAEHLDLPTADALTADLLAVTRGRTTVLITHRLTGLEQVDEIVVLAAGRVVQRGSYEQLAAQDGPFRSGLERERALQPAL
ncbi:thiol reductant ABC exporter subunit CydC [Streptomyces polyrhachis]|uniref:Thiol reductant ABC exporter subunit CydC n=1 Tax=Streptomyces polyrhachis TaxID=1282885 RepID=A0ABW2GB28_9ACTN